MSESISAEHSGSVARRETAEPLVLAFVAAAALVMLVASSFDYGITWDEPISQHYGNAAWRFYLSGFRERMAADNYYGAPSQVICAAAARVLSWTEFDVRHVCPAVVGWIGIVYAARLSRAFAGTLAAMLTIVFVIASPRYFAACMNNPKDLPFATAYTVSLFYVLSSGEGTKRLAGRKLVCVVASIAAAVAVRAAGLLLVGYFVVHGLVRSVAAGPTKQEIGRFVVTTSIVVVGSVLVGSVFWPRALPIRSFGRSRGSPW